MSRLVVGLGNALAGDDGFGPGVLRRLEEERGLPDDVERIACCTDLLSLVDVLDRYALVVLVDAVLGGEGAPGHVALLEERTLLTWPTRSTSAHRLSPVEALLVFRALKPEAPTTIALVALHTVAIGPRPVHATTGAIREGADLVRSALGPDTKKGHPGGCPWSS